MTNDTTPIVTSTFPESTHDLLNAKQECIVSAIPQNTVYDPHALMHRINPYTTETISDASPILKETPADQGGKQENLVKSKQLESFVNPQTH